MDSETKNKRRGGGRAYRSRLELFTEFIREQRRQRKTWQEIAARLRTEKDCVITFQGLHQFYRRYLKRQARSNWEKSEAATAKSATVNPSATTPQTTTTTETDNPYRFNNVPI